MLRDLALLGAVRVGARQQTSEGRREVAGLVILLLDEEQERFSRSFQVIRGREHLIPTENE